MSILLTNQAVIVETLKAANMMKNRRLARAIGDAGWAGFITKLEYKSAEKGVHLVKLDQWFASSKTCHNGGHRMPEMPLNKRLWCCPACHTEHDRDINTALNIKQQGIVELQAAGLVVSAHGGLRKSVSQTVAAWEEGSLTRQGGAVTNHIVCSGIMAVFRTLRPLIIALLLMCNDVFLTPGEMIDNSVKTTKRSLLLLVLTGLLFTDGVQAITQANSMANTSQAFSKNVSETWNNSDSYNLYVPAITRHNRLTYDKEKTDRYNERPWGGGMARIDSNGNGNGLYLMAFKDSYNQWEPIGGYGWGKKRAPAE